MSKAQQIKNLGSFADSMNRWFPGSMDPGTQSSQDWVDAFTAFAKN